MWAIFEITLSRSNLIAPTQNQYGRPSMFNLRKEIQEQMKVCKTLFHGVKHKPFTVE